MKKEKRRVFSYLWQVTGRSRVALLLLTVLEALLSFIVIGEVLAMRTALDGAVEQDREMLLYGILCMILLIVLQIAFRAWTHYLNERARATLENRVKKRLFHYLLHGDYASVEATHTGEWMNRMTSDTQVVAGGLCEILPSLIGMLVKLVGAMVLLLTLLPQISLFLIPAGVLSLGITWILREYMKKHHKRVQEQDGAVRSFLQERLSHMMIVRAFRAEDALETESDDRMAAHKAARMRRNHISNLCNVGFAAIMNGLYVLSFAYCGYGIIDGSMTYGTLLAVIQLIGQVQTPFAGISGILPRYYAMFASAERLLLAEDFPRESAKTLPETVEFSELQFTGVGFSYPDGERVSVFSDISFTMKKGDYVALIGYSGCGKSTLFKLLLSLYAPVCGDIAVTNVDGTTVPLGVEHRSLFAYVPQGNELMSGTVGEVICFGTDAPHDTEKLWNALEIACADAFVRALPMGLDTPLGEGGTGLSEGQLQRLAIARAIYAGPPVLLLDEATSALDEATERKVLDRLRAVTDKTVLIVTHRPAALDICDRILEVSDGKIFEQKKKL